MLPSQVSATQVPSGRHLEAKKTKSLGRDPRTKGQSRGARLPQMGWDHPRKRGGESWFCQKTDGRNASGFRSSKFARQARPHPARFGQSEQLLTRRTE